MSGRRRPSNRSLGFTLVEVLAAMLFMAIVIPVVVEGMTIAHRAGIVADRSRVAAQLADRLLTEVVLTEQWRDGDQTGEFEPDFPGYRWSLTTEAWQEDVMRLVWVEVTYVVQGREFSVRLCTLAPEEVSESEP